MKKSVLIIIFIVVAFLLFLAYLAYYFYFSFIFYESFNDPNPQTPDTFCNVDSDCILGVYPEWSKCEICGGCELFDINDTRVIAINEDWRPSCPFPKPSGALCVDCISTINNYRITDTNRTKCIENKCQKILN